MRRYFWNILDATGIIEASWDWPFGIKDLEVFGTKGYLHALNGNTIQQRDKDVYENIQVKQADYTNNIQYLADVLSGKLNPDHDLSSLENNLIVVRILNAALRILKRRKENQIVNTTIFILSRQDCHQ